MKIRVIRGSVFLSGQVFIDLGQELREVQPVGLGDSVHRDGGRDVAADMLHNAYGSARDNKDQVKKDMRTGRDRAQAQTERVTEGNSQGTAGARPRI